MQPGIAELDKPATLDDALDWAARGCYHACRGCGADTNPERFSECGPCHIEAARQMVIAAQQKILNGGGRCA